MTLTFLLVIIPPLLALPREEAEPRPQAPPDRPFLECSNTSQRLGRGLGGLTKVRLGGCEVILRGPDRAGIPGAGLLPHAGVSPGTRLSDAVGRPCLFMLQPAPPTVNVGAGAPDPAPPSACAVRPASVRAGLPVTPPTSETVRFPASGHQCPSHLLLLTLLSHGRVGQAMPKRPQEVPGARVVPAAAPCPPRRSRVWGAHALCSGCPKA